jgi:transcriptional antiterminator NusG
MRLAASLQEAGVSAWTPTQHVRRRVPRSKSVEHRIAPLAPTYVFVSADHLSELQKTERAAFSIHPRFSIFRHCGAPVFVKHRALHPLRVLQQQSYADALPNSGKRPSKRDGAHYDVGDRVAFTTGSFAGFEGFVEQSDGFITKVTISLFGRAQGVSVPTSQLGSRNVPAR